MSAIHVDGTRLEYVEQGQGEPVVLVHGTLGDYRSWEPQMEAFSQSFRVISYSRRYHHPNTCDGDESDYSAALHADDLAAFIGALGLDSAQVVGNSYGAYSALFLAARHPQRVRGLVLGEPPVFPLLEDSPEGRPLRDEFLATVWEPVGELLQREEMRSGVRKFVDGVVAEGAFDGFSEESQNLILDNACELKLETSGPDFWTHFTSQDAKRVTVPTLLLTGEKSLRMFQLIVEELGRSMPNGNIVRIPESTHEMPVDNTEAYNAAVLGFLEAQSELGAR